MAERRCSPWFTTFTLSFSQLPLLDFLRARAKLAIARISCSNSVRRVCLTRPGIVPRSGEIETSDFHYMCL